MKAKDLFTIILKVFGIYIIKDLLVSIPSVLSETHLLLVISSHRAAFSLFVALLVTVIYAGIVYILLFKTSWIISKLNLTSGLDEKPLVVNLHRSSVYTIAIIVAGLIVLVYSVPSLVRNFYFWYEYREALELESTFFNYAPILTSLAEVILGLLLLGNQQALVNFIELRRRRSTMVEGDKEEAELN